MDFHRGNKMKQQESTKYQRVPSPMTFIQDYNKICNDENEQTKQCLHIDRKHKNLFLWNDGYVALNRIKVPAVLEARKAKQRKYQLPLTKQQYGGVNQNGTSNQISNGNNNNYNYQGGQSLSDTDEDNNVNNIEQYKSNKQLRERMQEKELLYRTEKLARIIEANNSKQNKMRQSMSIVQSNATPNKQFSQTVNDVGFQLTFNDRIDTIKQRKYFSHTKQQMLELQNHLLTSQKISREIMDRKGLSLRKVLSSIPQEKLMQIIESKQFHFQKVMAEKIRPKDEFRAKEFILPKFRGENNYDYNKPPPRTAASSGSQFNTSGKRNPLSSAVSVASPVLSSTNYNGNSNIRKTQSQQTLHRQKEKKSEIGQDAKVLGSDQKDSINIRSGSSNSVSRVVKQTSQGEIQVNQDGLFYIKDNFGREEIDIDLLVQNEHGKQGGNSTILAGSSSSPNKKGLRVKSIKELNSLMEEYHEEKEIQKQKFQQYQQQNLPTQQRHEQGSYYSTDPTQLLTVSYEPKTTLEKMLQHQDEFERGQIITSLEEQLKTNTKKNFFNYSNYFYGKYSKSNNGTSTKLSSNAMEENQRFQIQLQSLIEQVDHPESQRQFTL